MLVHKHRLWYSLLFTKNFTHSTGNMVDARFLNWVKIKFRIIFLKLSKDPRFTKYIQIVKF